MNLKAWIVGIKYVPVDNKFPHDVLFSKLKTTGQDWSAREGNRLTQYCMLNDIIVARVNQKPLKVPFREETLSIGAGQDIEFIVRLPLHKRVTANTQGDKPLSSKLVSIPAEEAMELGCNLLTTKGGLTINESSVREADDVFFRCKRKVIRLNAVDVKVRGVINDPMAFSSIWYHGIGRFRTYGFGMLRVLHG